MYWCCITKSQKNKQKKSQQPSSNRREYQQRSTHSESTSSHQIHSISAATQQQTRHNQGYAVGQQSYGQSTYYPSNKSVAVINLNQSQNSTKSQIHSTNRHVRYPWELFDSLKNYLVRCSFVEKTFMRMLWAGLWFLATARLFIFKSYSRGVRHKSSLLFSNNVEKRAAEGKKVFFFGLFDQIRAAEKVLVAWQKKRIEKFHSCLNFDQIA